jgi:LAS superfamily LD-carboxypeptidase LdcB
MHQAAQEAGINLKIISATRTFAQQKGIWEEKWTRFAREAPGTTERALKILEYSAMPGASRHHWGTDIDLNDLNNQSFEPGGKYAKVYEWLQGHAHEFGFCQPYTAKNTDRPDGYNEERWHWSYVPLAKPLLQQYLQTVTNDMLTGFKGAETASSINTVGHYAAGINHDCK